MKAHAPAQPAKNAQLTTKRRKLPSFAANPGAYMQSTPALAKRTKELKGKTPKIAKSVFHEFYDPKLVEQLGPIPHFSIECEPFAEPLPEIRYVDPASLYIDRNYQRTLTPLDMRLLEDIIDDFSWDQFKVPNVFEDDEGLLYTTDGQKTTLGAIHRKVPLIPVMVCTAPQAELLRRQANAFIGINARRKAIPAREMFTALLVRGDKAELALAKILMANGIEPVANLGSGQHAQYKAGQTQSITILRTVHRHHGDANFDVMCKIMAAVRYRPIKREHIYAMGHILDKQDGQTINIDQMANAIRSIVDRHALLEARDVSRKSSKHTPVGLALADIYLARYKRKAQALG